MEDTEYAKITHEINKLADEIPELKDTSKLGELNNILFLIDDLDNKKNTKLVLEYLAHKIITLDMRVKELEKNKNGS